MAGPKKNKQKKAGQQAMGTKKKDNSQKTESYNGWRVLHFFLEGLFNLVNNNKIYPFFALLFFSLSALTIWRLPESELASILKLLINEFSVGKFALITTLFGTNLGWYALFRFRNKVHRNEIDRIAAERSELLHKSDTKLIENHRSSDSVKTESYIVPGSTIKDGKETDE